MIGGKNVSNILVVTGSVRPNNVNAKVVERVAGVLKDKDVTVTIADLGKLNMPFIDSPMPPSMPGFEPEHESVKEWTKMVDEADGVVFVSPEYNHNPSPVQMNAIDWISKEWNGKPVAIVAYGATSGGSQATLCLREAFSVTLKAHLGRHQANLFFGREIGYDGVITDDESVDGKIDAAVSELLETIEKYA